MVTASGRTIDLNNFHPSDVSIMDVARSLSFTNRFNGHINIGYTVAEHSLIMSRMLWLPEHKLEALLHDAEEAYTGDMILPMKDLFPEFEIFSARIAGTVISVLFPSGDYRDRLIVDEAYHKSPVVGRLDRFIALSESKYLRPQMSGVHSWPELVDSAFRVEVKKLDEEWAGVKKFYPESRALWIERLYLDEYDKLVREVKAL